VILWLAVVVFVFVFTFACLYVGGWLSSVRRERRRQRRGGMIR
jgi:hypothetical protein